MGRKLGYGFTVGQRQELWDRYQRGESLNAIARALGKTSSSIYNHLSPTGGMRPVGIDKLTSQPEQILTGIAYHAAIQFQDAKARDRKNR